jgi:F-type H+-transporting ATPase subunit a
MFKISREITAVHPDTVFTIGSFEVANTTLLSVLILFVLLILSLIFIRRYKTRPVRGQTAVELLYESMLSFIGQITGSRKHAEKIAPLVATIFVYVGLSNLITLIPGLTSIQFGGVTVFRSPTTDFNTTFGLALGKFFKFKEVYLGFKQGVGPGFMTIVEFFIGLLDIIGEIAKVISLSLRLFGNMYAGEVLAILILSAFAFVLPVTWSAMTILSGIVQALVFGSLVTAYYMLAIRPKDET